MSRWRKIDVRISIDERVRRLSRPPPNGRSLFDHLLYGPSTSNVPGLYRAGEAHLAEELEWPLEGFREAFREVLGEGLVKADWKARLVWVPGAIKYNRPESPNVVRSWRSTWDELPVCALKAEAFSRFKAFLEGYAKAYAEAFSQACAEPYGESGAGAGAGSITHTSGVRAIPLAPVVSVPARGGTGHGMTGQRILDLFAESRSKAYEGGLPWTTPQDPKGHSSAMAASMDAAAAADVPETMRRFWEHVKVGDYDNAPKMAAEVAFGFGCWRAKFHDLREEIHGKAPPAPPARAVGNSKPRDIRYGSVHIGADRKQQPPGDVKI